MYIQQHSIILWTLVYMSLGSSRPWRNKYMKYRNALGSLQPSHTTFYLPVFTYGLRRSSLWSIDQGRGNSALVYRWFCIVCSHYLKVDSGSTIVPSWGILEGMWGRGFPPRTLSSAPSCSFCLEGKMATCTVIFWFIAMGNHLIGGSGTWKEHDWRTGDKEVWRRNVWINLSDWVKKWRYLCSMSMPTKRKSQQKRILIMQYVEGLILWIPISFFS